MRSSSVFLLSFAWRRRGKPGTLSWQDPVPWLVLVTLGCADEATSPPTNRVTDITDSAGVRIVMNAEPQWGPGEGWRFTSDPMLTLGVVDTPLVQQFHRIDGVTRLSDGTIVVLNRGSGELRAFDSSGRHLWSAGGLGQGPGEIIVDGRSHLRRGPGDTLHVRSGINRIRRSPSGELIDHTRPDVVGYAGCRPTVHFIADTLVACRRMLRPRIPGPWTRESVYVRISPARNWVDTIGTFLIEDGWAEQSLLGRTIRSPLGPKGKIRISDREPTLLYARNDRYRIEFWDLMTGTLSMVVERPSARRVRTEVEIFLAVRWGLNPEPIRSELRADDDRFSVVDSLSIADDFFLDETGHLWVRRIPSPLHGDPGIPVQISDGLRTFVQVLPSGLHDVFLRDGLYLGTVKLPADLREIEVGPDYVLGVTTDELGVEYVKMFGLDRGAG